ncbi:MAG: DUF3617 family protein [Desulfuromonadaceae bacterium]|nr:DUF3617 family protein [Desulfuromonadaceae bacterium]MDD5105505.1 DUF3617 family protein [Desulfuromonadaceae bacterium]
MKFRIKIVLVAVAALFPGAVYAAGEIQEGQWEISTTMEMPGMPFKMPPQVMKHCYSKNDVKDQKNVINRDKDCSITEFKTSGNKVSWKMVCTGEKKGTFSGETVFSGNSYTSNMKMSTEGQNMTMNVKGKRIGNCP